MLWYISVVSYLHGSLPVARDYHCEIFLGAMVNHTDLFQDINGVTLSRHLDFGRPAFFDFSLYVEDTLFSVPASIFLLVAAARIYYLSQRPKKVSHSLSRQAKLVRY